MEETHVVTCFLWNRGEVLLLRRSDAVGSYRGKWGAVAGHAEGDPEGMARQEIQEETGLGDACDLIRAGEPFPVEDEQRGTRWVVHPHLFEYAERAVCTNEETSEHEWAPPTELLRRETVPELWASYDAVRPTVERIAADRERGSAALSIDALAVLRDEAALAAERGIDRDLAALARDLLAARPGMAVLRNRVNRAMCGTDAADPAAVEAAASEGIARAAGADDAVSGRAADLVTGERVATLSRSGTVVDALRRGEPAAVLVAESRPGGEGIGVAETLAERTDADVTLTSDAAAPGLLASWGADRVLVGADAVLPDGRVANKVGTHPLALAAREVEPRIPVTIACARDKIRPADGGEGGSGSGAERGGGDRAGDGGEGGDGGAREGIDPETAPPIYEGDADVSVANPLFEAVPASLVDVVTEEGPADATALREAAAEHARLAAW